MRDVAIWNATLSAGDFANLSSSGTPPAPPSATFSFTANTTANNTVRYWTSSYIDAQTLATNVPGYSNTTITLYYGIGGVANITVGTGNLTTANYTGLGIGVYYLNATALNSTGAALYSGTYRLTLYNVTNASILAPSYNQTVNDILQVSWTNATTTNASVAISNYTVNLLNDAGGLLYTLNVNASNNYTTGIYDLNLSTGQYIVEVIANDAQGNTARARQLIMHPRNAELNITAFDANTNVTLTSFNITAVSLNDSAVLTGGTSSGVLLLHVVKGYLYNLTTDAAGYALKTQAASLNGSNRQTLNVSLSKTNSVSIQVLDESTLALITNATGGPVNVTFTSNLSSYSYNTTTGLLFVSNITQGFYEVKFNAPNYAQRSYFITITDRSTQSLNAFLSQSSITLLMTYVDGETGALIENVGVVVAKVINGTWTTVASGFTDITGRVQFSVSTSTNYRFSSTVAGYDDKTFNLNPVIFTSYTIQLHKIATTGSQLDFSNVNVYVQNASFTNNGTNTFLWQISAPAGNLQDYAYTLTTTCKNVTAFSGTNAYGDINSLQFNLSCASLYDAVVLRYNYTLTGGEVRQFSYTYSIYGTAPSNSFMQNKDEHYGMGLFERALITVLMTIIMAGLITRFSNIVAGLGAGLFILGYLSYIGFIEWWLIAPTLLVGFIVIAAWSRSG